MREAEVVDEAVGQRGDPSWDGSVPVVVCVEGTGTLPKSHSRMSCSSSCR